MRHLYALMALLIATAPAMAQSPLEMMFPMAETCYQRVYSKAHLAAHPAQSVTSIAVGRTDVDPQGQGDAVLAVALTRRGDPETYVALAYCTDQVRTATCLMEADEGTFTLLPHENGGLLLKVAPCGMGFEGHNGSFALSDSSGDDHSFLMPFVGKRACP